MAEQTPLNLLDSIAFEFALISYEFYSLEEILNILRDQKSSIMEQKMITGAERIKEIHGDDSVSDLLRQGHVAQFTKFINVIYPRFLNCSMLVILYAICEAAITEIASIIQKKENLNLSMDDIRGGFLKRAAKYYERVLSLKIFNSNEAWKRFEVVRTVRNAVVHANGRYELVIKDVRKELDRIIDLGIGVEIADDYILVTEEFLSETFTMLRDAIEDLINRTTRRSITPIARKVKDG